MSEEPPHAALAPGTVGGQQAPHTETLLELRAREALLRVDSRRGQGGLGLTLAATALPSPSRTFTLIVPFRIIHPHGIVLSDCSPKRCWSLVLSPIPLTQYLSEAPGNAREHMAATQA